MSIWQQLVAIVRDMPREAALGMNRWVMRQHGPEDVYGDGSRAVCLRCKVDWPCEEFMSADRRVDEIINR